MLPSAERLRYLDGLRGIAVLCVVLFHYTDDLQASCLPYGSSYTWLPLSGQGWAGVNLFFLISGFVIFMTLDRCESTAEFLARRWLRLFPAMLIATVAIFALSRVNAAFMIHGTPRLLSVLPGLTFISPGIWQWFAAIDELDGVFWTLYIEVGFYLIAGLTFFRLGWRGTLAVLTVLWLGTYAAARLGPEPVPLVVQFLQFIGAEYFGWFVSGALFYQAWHGGSRALLTAALLVGLAASQTSDLWQYADLTSRLVLAGVVLFFAVAQTQPRLQRLLSVRPLLAAGFASYPMYLLHNEIGVGLIGRLGSWGVPDLWPALLVGAALFATSYAIAARAEPWLRMQLRPFVDKLVNRAAS